MTARASMDAVSTPRPGPRALFDERAPFLRSDGLRAGITRYRLDGPGFHRLFGTVRVHSDLALTPRLRAQSARLVVPTAVASHQTAACLWGGIVPDTAQTHVIVASASERRDRPGLSCHVGARPATAVVDGVPATTPAQTFVDLAGCLDLVDLVVLGDSLVHRQLVSVDELLACGVVGRASANARRAAELVRVGAESPMETRSRLLLVFAGLPEPRSNHWVADESGRRRYRLDLAYLELRLAFEYEGRQHAEDPQQYAWDIARREWLDGQGWRLILLRAGDIYRTPWATALRAQAALAQRGCEIVLSAQPPERFRLHFPGRPWHRTG